MASAFFAPALVRKEGDMLYQNSTVCSVSYIFVVAEEQAEEPDSENNPASVRFVLQLKRAARCRDPDASREQARVHGPGVKRLQTILLVLCEHHCDDLKTHQRVVKQPKKQVNF